jgi:hypothetical protein
MSIINLSLPKIPANKAENLATIKAKPASSVQESILKPENPPYETKEVNETLTTYLESLFPFSIRCLYCFEPSGFPVRNETNIDYRIVYALDSGGAEQKNLVHLFDSPGKLAESKSIDTLTWYSLPGDKFYFNNIDPAGIRITLEILPLGTTSEVTTFIQNNTI